MLYDVSHEFERLSALRISVLSSSFLDCIIGENREFLVLMLRTVNVSPKILADLDIITDFSYAWDIIHDYTQLMHEKIRTVPRHCLLLRSTFLKLASILSLPLVRITQAASEDDVSVADYFSSALVQYVRLVLDVIPRSVFTILDEIIALQTNSLKPVPTKLERKYLKDYAQLDARYTLAKATHQVSVFTQGILAMKRTIVGIIKLDPRQLLEDGIRKELVAQVTHACHDTLVFRTGRLEDFEARVSELGKKLDGFRQSFTYIQDYINVYGLKIWQEEFSRIIHYSVEQESNQFLKKKIYDWQSAYQSDAIPIPTYPPIVERQGNANAAGGKEISINFMGRLTRELLAQTDPKHTVYTESAQGWYDVKGQEVVGIRTFSLLHRGNNTRTHTFPLQCCAALPAAPLHFPFSLYHSSSRFLPSLGSVVIVVCVCICIYVCEWCVSLALEAPFECVHCLLL